jgi:hypothetical protein
MESTLKGKNAQQQLGGFLNSKPQLSGELNNISLTYDSIIGKPKINDVVLVDNLSTSDLKISHKDILDNDALNLHSISAISGLQEELNSKETVESVNNKLQDLNNQIDTKINNAVNTYIFIQNSAEPIWMINHNLNKIPSVTVIDSAGSIVIGEITYVDMNNIIVTFSGAFSGKALLN